MSVFLGMACFDPAEGMEADCRRILSILTGMGGGSPQHWVGPGAAITHLQRIVTTEDRAERMPLLHAEGRRVLVLDGRLDNRSDVIARLALPGAAAAWPDGALVAAALDRDGDDACRMLRGEFVFADWDLGARRLLMASSPTGGRSLYFHVGAGRILFATQLQAVMACPGVPRVLDEEVLAWLLLRAYPLTIGRSVYRNVAMLGSGSCVLWADGHLRSERYWRPDFSRRIRFARDEDSVEAARELLDRAVADSLRAEGPVACQLSGASATCCPTSDRRPAR